MCRHLFCQVKDWFISEHFTGSWVKTRYYLVDSGGPMGWNNFGFSKIDIPRWYAVAGAFPAAKDLELRWSPLTHWESGLCAFVSCTHLWIHIQLLSAVNFAQKGSFDIFGLFCMCKLVLCTGSLRWHRLCFSVAHGMEQSIFFKSFLTTGDIWHSFPGSRQHFAFHSDSCTSFCITWS